MLLVIIYWLLTHQLLNFFYYTWTKPFLHLLHPLKFHEIIVNHFSGNRIHRCKTNGDVFSFVRLW